MNRKGFKGTHEHTGARAALWCQSRSLFIRTMTVGSGIGPDLLTPGSGPGRSRARACAPTAGGELHPALKTFVYRRTGAASVPARAERGRDDRGRIPFRPGKGSDPGSLEIAEGSEPFSDGKRIRPRCRPARILMTGVGSLSAGKGSDPGQARPACDGRLSHFVKLSLKSAADDMRSPRAAARAGPPMD